MDTDDNNIKRLEAKKEHLVTWLDRYRKAQEVAPLVQMNLELTEWEIQALSNRPSEAHEIPLMGLNQRITQDCEYLTRSLPLIPDYNPTGLMNSTAIAMSGSATVYQYVARVGDLNTPQAVSYSQKFTGLYHDIQISQERPRAVRDLITKLNNPQTIQRFDRAQNVYNAARIGTGSRTGAATDMRTLLDGIQGDLFDRARKHKKENMTWGEMASRLAKGDQEKQELEGQENVRSSLISRLSTILKDREGGSVSNLENVWTQVLDHIYVTLSLAS